MKKIKLFLLIICAVASVLLAVGGVIRLFGDSGEFTLAGNTEMVRALTADEEGYDEDSTVCDVEYFSADGELSCVLAIPYEEWVSLPEKASFEGFVYENGNGERVVTAHEADQSELRALLRDVRADENSALFQSAAAVGLVAVSLAVITFFDSFFTAYEKWWFISIMILAAVFAVFMPEESCNGVDGIWIMILYLADTFLNILCELLISKQSKWNFIVSVFVEIAEILICVVLAYRFATMATTLFFWLPCDIISFVNWHKHPDSEEEELTVVRTLHGFEEVLIIAGIFVWTLGVGYALTLLDVGSELFAGNRTLEVVVCYLDACASAVGVANGLFILFRFREQWIAWYISAILEGVINVLSGQYILLVLKLGYITNTTYGYIKWTRYIGKTGSASSSLQKE